MSDDGDLLAMLLGIWGEDEELLDPPPPVTVARPSRRQRRRARRAARLARRRGDVPPAIDDVPIEVSVTWRVG